MIIILVRGRLQRHTRLVKERHTRRVKERHTRRVKERHTRRVKERHTRRVKERHTTRISATRLSSRVKERRTSPFTMRKMMKGLYHDDVSLAASDRMSCRQVAIRVNNDVNGYSTLCGSASAKCCTSDSASSFPRICV